MIGRTNSSIGGGKIKSLNKSCVVWLPLNGNTKNYGNSDLTFYPNSTYMWSVYGGNIYPGYYYSPTHGNGGGIISDKAILLDNNQSMFCWCNFEHLESESNLGGGVISQHRYASNTGMGITFKYVNDSSGYLSITEGTGTDRTYNTYTGKTLLNAGAWYHIGFTYDGTTVNLYVNGKIDGTYNLPNRMNPADFIQVGSWTFNSTSGSSLYNGYLLQGGVQDIRIYDRALKPEEVNTIYNWRPLSYLRTKPVRYIRWSAAGSTLNTGTHFCEVQVFDGNGTNLARGKTLTNVASGANVNALVTDGDITYSSYIDIGNSGAIQLDLGGVYDISHIMTWHYWGDSRSYYNVTTLVSTDGTSWETMFNSETMGRYRELINGHATIMVPGP